MGSPIALLIMVASLLRITDGAASVACGKRPMAENETIPHTLVGSDAAPGSWPWAVSIQSPLKEDYYHMCAGTLINTEWVLSAAHCFKDEKQYMYLWRFVIGSSQLSRLGVEVQVREALAVVIHEEYDKQKEANDIAIVRLSQAVILSNFVQPACLPTASVNVYTMTNCQVCGWSVMVDNVFTTADILQEAHVNLIPLERCNSGTWYNGAIFAYNLCAGYEEGEIDSCQGDSGGPLMCQDPKSHTFFVVGVTSWERGCYETHNPGVYSSTKYFLKWIRTNIVKGEVAEATSIGRESDVVQSLFTQ